MSVVSIWTSAVGIASPLARFRRISRKRRFATARIESDLARQIEAIESLPIDTAGLWTKKGARLGAPCIAMHLAISDDDAHRHLTNAALLCRKVFDP